MCLNEAVTGMGKGVIKPWAKRLERLPLLESEADDPEIIITIPFTVGVNINSFCIVGSEKDHSPNKVKIFVNRDDIDFDLARDLTPIHEMDLVEDFVAGIDYPLPPKRFKGVSSITLFIPSNFTGEDEKTMLSYIGFKGEGTAVRRGVVDTVYEASAQMKDHQKVEGTDNMQSYLT